MLKRGNPPAPPQPPTRLEAHNLACVADDEAYKGLLLLALALLQAARPLMLAATRLGLRDLPMQSSAVLLRAACLAEARPKPLALRHLFATSIFQEVLVLK